MNTAIKWAAELAQVREVSLLGTADLAFWKERLQGEELLPAECDGRAQLLVSAAEGKYMGARFREVSFSVLVCPETGCPWDAACLIRAFNSSRLFAFCERAIFSTPYYFGDVRLDSSLPASIRLVDQGEPVFAAAMGDAAPDSRQPSRCGDDGWEGLVFLPAKRRGGRPGKLFVARVNGYTRRYPFVAGLDSMAIRPSPESEVFGMLEESHFAVKEWILRDDARHAKSKTYAREFLLSMGRATI